MPGEWTKYDKRQVEYGKGTSKEHCKICNHFGGTHRDCEVVAGDIDPDDWCNKFFLHVFK